MTATQIAIAIVLGVFALAAASAVFGLGLPKTYRERKCAGNEWRSQFPAARKEEIREFLSVFVLAFGFREKEKLKFRPDDKLLDIRDKANPIKGIDALELEALSVLVKKKYGIELAKLWSSELTLGSLFNSVAKPGTPPDLRERPGRPVDSTVIVKQETIERRHIALDFMSSKFVRHSRWEKL